jgi:hypothetical protein
MTSTDLGISPNRLARIAGFLHLSLIPVGVFGILYVPSVLFVPGDIATTASNIAANESLFRLSIVSAFLAQIINIFVVVLLYKLLKPASKNLAALMVIFLLLGVPIAMLNELTNYATLILVGGSEYAAIFTTEQSQALASLFLDLHLHGIFTAQIFWGLWLLPMGILAYKSGFIPRVLGVLLVIGGLGYLIDSFLFFVYPSFPITFTQFTFLGELLFPLWLLIKGVNVERWEESAFESTQVVEGRGSGIEASSQS